MRSSEIERIRRLSEILGANVSADGRVIVGIGDDAAVLAGGPEPLVWTIDSAVEGVHFERAWMSFEDIGFRATMAAVSDLGAMGAEPLGVLAGLVLPEDVRDEDLFAIARGQREASERCGTAVIGGNLARGRELSIATTALGRAPRPIQRKGARPGDRLWLLGPVGLAAAGLRASQRGLSGGALDACLAAFRRPRARIEEGLSLRGIATSAVDVSDGLARDVGHLARASGVTVVIDEAAFDAPESPGAADPMARSTLRQAAAELGIAALELALHGGEDYAIAFTTGEGADVPGAVKIGWIEAEYGPSAEGASGRAERPSVLLQAKDGARRAIAEAGFDHFARSSPG